MLTNIFTDKENKKNKRRWNDNKHGSSKSIVKSSCN